MTASHRRLLPGPLLGKGHWRAIPEAGVPPLSVIEDLDVLRDLAPCLLTGLVVPVIHQFVLQRAPKTFHRSIIVAVTSPTHGRGHATLADLILIGLGAIQGGFNRSTQHL
jgi:hypothetical protein